MFGQQNPLPVPDSHPVLNFTLSDVQVLLAPDHNKIRMVHRDLEPILQAAIRVNKIGDI